MPPVPKKRVCRKCGEGRPSRFYNRKSIAGIAAGHCCRQCWVRKSVEWRRANRDPWNRRRHFKNLERKFGMTEAEYEALYKDAACHGCGATSSQGGARRLAVDHCHKTGKVRGLLCHDCNRTIATAHDDPEILRRLVTYLELHR